MKLAGPLPIHVQEFQQQLANKSAIPKVDPTTVFATGTSFSSRYSHLNVYNAHAHTTGVQDVQLALSVAAMPCKRQEEGELPIDPPHMTSRNEIVIPISPHPTPVRDLQQQPAPGLLAAQEPEAPKPVEPQRQMPQLERASLYDLFCRGDEFVQCEERNNQPQPQLLQQQQAQPVQQQQQQQQEQQPARRIVRSRYFACHQVHETFDTSRRTKHEQHTHQPYRPVSQMAKQVILGNQTAQQQQVDPRLRLTSSAFCVKLSLAQ